MKTLHNRCAGLDVHKVEVVACLRLVRRRKVEREVRRCRFLTTTRGLLELAEWLERGGCTHVAMKATGVYWKPIWHLLEGRFELVLANAAHVKNVPGRKSDVNDATWLADLLAHGLIRESFVPPPAIQELRDLTRTRKQLTREIVQHVQRIQAVLEEANVKLSSVITDLLGPSGRRILKAMIAGETDAAKLAALGSERLGCPRATLVEALTGRVREHHRFLLAQHLQTIEQLEGSVAAFDARIEAALAPRSAPICAGFRPRGIFSLGRGSSRALMRAPASAVRHGSGRALPGSSLCWCNAHGPQRARKVAISRPNSCA